MGGGRELEDPRGWGLGISDVDGSYGWYCYD